MQSWKTGAACAVLISAFGVTAAQGPAVQSSTLESGFQTPPESAKPRAWWHWMSGNVSQEGITADLEWMHRVGIGGFQMFDGDLGVPTYVAHPIIWMTPEWKAAFKHTGEEADRLHLEMAMAASGGWSETAGPWVKPEEAMKKVVWSETVIAGGHHVHVTLASPPRNNGPFQALPDGTNNPTPDPTFYKDSIILVYRRPQVETEMANLHSKITSSDPAFNIAAVTDQNYSTSAHLNIENGKDEGWIQWEFDQPVPARSFAIQMAATAGRPAPLPIAELSSSDDGNSWTKVLSIAAASSSARTWSFSPVRARYFRIVMRPAGARAAGPAFFNIADLELSSAPRINLFEDKAGFNIYMDQPSSSTPTVDASDAIVPANVINLTAKMTPDGTLDWDAPAGDWTILRMGYSLTGKKNHPATPAATGFEVDKLSAEHVRQYMQTYTGMISGALGDLYAKSFQYFLMDSWEAGRENWTDTMVADFTRLRGYDPTPYLAALTGKVVGSAEKSDAFLWDFRRTLADLLAENHYKLAHDFLATQHIGLYAEAMGIGLPTVGDGLLNKGQVSIPMGEFWTPRAGAADAPTREADVMETTSAAHIYGKPIAATESFTSQTNVPGWGQSPFYLKGLADQNFARGVNRIVFHTSDEQPFVDDKHKPGITLNRYGQHYTRNITWAEQAVAWNTYLARCSYLLQQGQPTADIAYFYGEGAPVTVPYWKQFSPVVPTGYALDYLNSDVLLHQTSVIAGQLVLKAGPRYRVLVIPDEFTSLTLPLLRQISALVKAGALVVAPRTLASPSLADQSSSNEINQLATAIWGQDKSTSGSHTFGKGKIYWGTPLEKVFAAEHITPDLSYDTPHAEQGYNYPLPDTKAADIVWIHRKSVPGDLYFVSNQRSQSETVSVSFRITGQAAELWHPDTGTTEPASYHTSEGRTIVDLHLQPLGSVFVVFHNPGPPLRTAAAPAPQELLQLPETWKIIFPPNLGAPAQSQITKLASWTDSSDPGIRYFSGTATYSQDVDLTSQQLTGGKVLLDLGRVREIAEVTINGRKLSQILWKPPFIIDISAELHPGQNHLEINVTNLWPNRIIGDQQTGTKEKFTFTVYPAYTADSPLLESGLLGPVRLMQER